MDAGSHGLRRWGGYDILKYIEWFYKKMVMTQGKRGMRPLSLRHSIFVNSMISPLKISSCLVVSPLDTLDINFWETL